MKKEIFINQIHEKILFEVSPAAWCEHCGDLAKGKCAHGHEAISVSAKDPEGGVRWCPSCMLANGYITQKQCDAAWALIGKAGH